MFQFFVRAEDSGGRHSDVPVEVYVMSPLDRPPVFGDGDTTYYVMENSPIGKVVAQVTASVGDTAGSNSLEEDRKKREDESE